MAVVIRLRREGRKNRPFYRVVVTDRQSPRDGKFIEQVGIYDPVKKEEPFKLDKERINHWIGKGAKPSDTVRSFIKKSA